MGGALGKFLCILTGRDTPEEIERRRQADAVLKSIEKATHEVGQVAMDTRVWAEKITKRCTERKAQREKVSKNAAGAVADAAEIAEAKIAVAANDAAEKILEDAEVAAEKVVATADRVADGKRGEKRS